MNLSPTRRKGERVGGKVLLIAGRSCGWWNCGFRLQLLMWSVTLQFSRGG